MGSQLSNLSIDHSNFYGGESYLSLSSDIILNWGSSSFDRDPLFCNPSEGEYTLQENSYCLSASDSFGLIGAYGQACSEELRIDKTYLPRDFNLYQNYPNPFNPTTLISFSVDRPQNINLSIFNINGILVKEAINDYFFPGLFSFKWNGMDNNYNVVPSGMYIYRLKSSEKIMSKKMIFSK